MSCKAAIYVSNTGSQTVPDSGVISLGSIIRRFGCGVNLNGNGIAIDREGYYDVSASLSIAAGAAGPVTVTLFRDGVAVPGATATVTAAAAGDIVNLSIEALVRQAGCCAGGSTLTLSIVGVGGTVNNVALKVIKL